MRLEGKQITIIALAAAMAVGIWVWSTRSNEGGPSWFEKEYGITNAFSEQVLTPDGNTVEATIIPVVLADGRTAQLIVPSRSTAGTFYYRDGSGGLYPVVLAEEGLGREEFVRSEPVIVERQAATPRPAQSPQRTETAKKDEGRSWEKEVLIVAGSAGAGAGIGAIAGGKKGAAIGAASGGVAGLIYDLATRDKED